MADKNYIRYYITKDDPSLFSRHYIENILRENKTYVNYDAAEFITKIEGLAQATNFEKLAAQKEVAAEFNFITKVFDALSLPYELRPNLGSKEIDYALYAGDEFFDDYTNAIGIVEAKRNGRIANHYYEKVENPSDIIYQTRYYLKELNLLLANHNSKAVDFALLTDGFTWRLYNRAYTHAKSEFEKRFIEFNLVDILHEQDKKTRHDLLKLFSFMLDKTAWRGRLQEVLQESVSYGEAVTEELKKQVFTSLELIATGLWRNVVKDTSYSHKLILKSHYGIDVDSIGNEEVKNELLKIIYDESLIFLLRLLFILYTEDRDLFEERRIIKGPDGLVGKIAKYDYPIGQIPAGTDLELNYDVRIADHCKWIDKRYNGGLFSSKLHPLLEGFNIDDSLFANAMDNLCRVPVGKNILIVDFSSIGVRELGTIYEGLLEYKLAVQQEYAPKLVSIVDKKKVRLDVQEGDLYIINHKGERKSSGSYYTPDTIVDYLVEQTVTSKVNFLSETFKEPEKLLEQIMQLRVVDPAMGSGHFLLSAFDALSHQAFKLAEESDLEISFEDIKTQLARKCIYGVDINPVAVDLAKMILWIKVFNPNKPFEFFDYNLTCGNSLIGVYDEKPIDNDQRVSFFRNLDEIEAETVAQLDDKVVTMLAMPRETRAQIEELKQFYAGEVQSRQKAISLLYNLKLVKYLDPDNTGLVNDMYEELLKKIESDPQILTKLADHDDSVAKKYQELSKISEGIATNYRPLHWKITFPHVFLQGGFDIVLGNPPWDIIKPDHNSFFSDYIDGYAYMETKESKKLSEELTVNNSNIGNKYEQYINEIDKQNRFFADAYRWQVVSDRQGTKLSGDNNLYKVFIEKAYTILRHNGLCGFVVPSGLNSDQGCTGLRRLLFKEAGMRELIMFDNKRAIFPAVHRQYKFDVLSFCKERSRKKSFTTGFYWQDPRWLGGEVKTGEHSHDVVERAIHQRFIYPIDLTEKLSPEMDALVEARSEEDVPIIEKIAQYPLLGDGKSDWSIRIYTEFHMTKDSDLFNIHGEGYPLFEGKIIHQFDAHLERPTRFLNSTQGETRLSKRWKKPQEDLPNRQYRIGYRSIGRSTDSRTLIATLLPKYVFAGNSINLIETDLNRLEELGLLAILNSVVADYLMRMRVSANINSFYVKELPVPRSKKDLSELGAIVLPLLYGRDFDELRGNVHGLDPSLRENRSKQRATLDARVAKVYNISYEELQHILIRFPLVPESYKQEVLHCYRSQSPIPMHTNIK